MVYCVPVLVDIMTYNLGVDIQSKSSLNKNSVSFNEDHEFNVPEQGYHVYRIEKLETLFEQIIL